MKNNEMIEYLRTYFKTFRDYGYTPELNQEAIEDIDAHLEMA